MVNCVTVTLTYIKGYAVTVKHCKLCKVKADPVTNTVTNAVNCKVKAYPVTNTVNCAK